MSNLKKILVIAILSAAGAVLSIIESMLPILTAIPGGKLGIANIVTIIALYIMGPTSALAVSVIRTVISSALYGGFNAFIYSFSGAVFSTLIMIIAKKSLGKNVSTVGVSVLGAAAHNVAQVAVAWFFIRTEALWFYLACLLLLSSLFGVCSGFCAGECIKRLDFKG